MATDDRPPEQDRETNRTTRDKNESVEDRARRIWNHISPHVQEETDWGIFCFCVHTLAMLSGKYTWAKPIIVYLGKMTYIADEEMQRSPVNVESRIFRNTTPQVRTSRPNTAGESESDSIGPFE